MNRLRGKLCFFGSHPRSSLIKCFEKFYRQVLFPIKATSFLINSVLMEKFLNDGWFLIPNAFRSEFRIKSIEWLRSATARAENQKSLEAEFEEDFVNGSRPVRKLRRLLWNDLEFWVEILQMSEIFDLARHMIKGIPAVIHHASFLKPKLVGSSIGFHQDQGLWSRDYPNAFNVWIALTECNLQNGCIELFSGSHRLGLLPHVKDPLYPWHPIVSKEISDSRQPVDVPMSAGDIIIWHRYLVHGSGPNVSNEDRLGMVLVFADASEPTFGAKDTFRLPEVQK